MSEIWRKVGGKKVVHAFSGRGFRLVESQETAATTRIVSSLEHQALLEQMLDEESKPAYRAGSQRLHYLLATPFRYPPLRHGSRFGSRFEPALFYGGTAAAVTLCEGAYYRLFFYHDMAEPPVDRLLQTQHTLFSFGYLINSGVRLQKSPFEPYRKALCNPADYSATQALGAAMRENAVDGFEYPSARDRSGGTNVALFHPGSFTRKQPLNKQACLCEVDSQRVVFNLEGELIFFTIGEFQLDGILPVPGGLGTSEEL